MALGKGQYGDIYYCSTSNGESYTCGPDGGIQCRECINFNVMYAPLKTNQRSQTKLSNCNLPVNARGFPMFVGNDDETLYCRRRACRTTDGLGCGPDKGPQCQACKGFSLQKPRTSVRHIDVTPLNRAGCPITPGADKCSRFMYCGRKLGKSNIPNSNGVCGPFDGPQCSDCKGFVVGNEGDSSCVIV